MTKVKICGITNLEDAMLSAKFGADALGFNFYEKSPRYILPEVARNIIDGLPKDILNVGVFVNESLEKVIEIAKTANLDAIQLHGEETPKFAKELKTKTGLEIIKAFRVSEDFKPEDVLQYEVNAILLDAYSPKEHGGTGETFDWDIAKRVKEIFPKMYLAGGISEENVTEAIEKVKPFAVDTCSNVEISKGKKDAPKIDGFIKTVRQHKYMRIFPPNNIYDLLVFVERRPEGCFGEKTLTGLITFIYGYGTATRQHDIKFDYLDYINFEQWIADKFDEEFKVGSTTKRILSKVNNDDELAFDYFFKLLSEYKLLISNNE